MLNTAYRNSFSEVIDILEHMKKEDVQKISPKFMEYLKTNASKTYVSTLDHSKTIKEMNLNPRTKAILALIYKKYWMGIDENKKNDENGKIYSEFQNFINLNENISSNTETNVTTQQIVGLETKLEDKRKVELVVYKESFFEKIMKTIKSIFKRNESINLKNY